MKQGSVLGRFSSLISHSLHPSPCLPPLSVSCLCSWLFSSSLRSLSFFFSFSFSLSLSLSYFFSLSLSLSFSLSLSLSVSLSLLLSFPFLPDNVFIFARCLCLSSLWLSCWSIRVSKCHGAISESVSGRRFVLYEGFNIESSKVLSVSPKSSGIQVLQDIAPVVSLEVILAPSDVGTAFGVPCFFSDLGHVHYF